MNVKKLLIIGVCLFAGQVSAKKRCPKEVPWPWAQDWVCAKRVVVTNTLGAGKGSFRWAVDECNSSEVPVHITFCMSKDDLGYNCERNCWVIKMLEQCVFTNKVWIDGFSQRCCRPNTNGNCQPNNACWAIEFEGGTTTKPDSCGLDFQGGSNGSVVTGVCMCLFTKDHGWRSAIRTASEYVTVCGVACSTDCSGKADKPNTCSVLDTGTNNWFGVRGMCEARSIWGGLGSIADNEGAFTFEGHGARLVGGTLGLDRCGTSLLNSGAEVGILINVPEGQPNGKDLTVDCLTAAGFSECIICAESFDNVCIKSSLFGADCNHQEPIIPTKIAIKAVNTAAMERGTIDITGNIIGGVETAVVIGEGSMSLSKVIIDTNCIGETVPNKNNVVISNAAVVEVSNNTSANATEGSGLTLGENVPEVKVGDNSLVNNSNAGLVVMPTVQVAPVLVFEGEISGNSTGVQVFACDACGLSSQVIVTSPISNNATAFSVFLPNFFNK